VCIDAGREQIYQQIRIDEHDLVRYLCHIKSYRYGKEFVQVVADPRTFGWDRCCNTHEGEYNNDLSFSNQAGDTWTVILDARRFSIIAPQGMGQGIMEVLVDGKHVGEVSFTKNQGIKHQSVVFTSKKLSKGKHEIQLKNKSGMVAIDAIIIQ
jgi:hypothetical protein